MDAARELETQTKAALALREHLKAILNDADDDEEDIDLVRDAVEGETNLHESIYHAAQLLQETESYAEALKDRLNKMGTRAARYKGRINLLRTAIQVAMEAGELPKIELDFVTLSRGKKPRALIITDEAAIPSNYWVTGDPKLDKKKLIETLKGREALERSGLDDAEPIPGAELDNGGEKLSVRWR